MVTGDRALRLRARGVHVIYRRQAGCPSSFAEVTIDFEPLSDDQFGYEFVNHLPAGDADAAVVDLGVPDVNACLAALGEGIHEVLLQESGQAPLATRAVLRHARFHVVDSSPSAFQQAGRQAVRTALESPRTVAQD